jgi:medium-chain acyl-[acyl-carrier-protein] hydrolase
MPLSVKPRVLAGLNSNPDASVRLFCFPFAGGGTAVYRQWRSTKQQIEIVAVELPGRGLRSSEPPVGNLTAIVEEMAETIPFDGPFALFGHSMGALISYELARSLARRQITPQHLFVSSHRAPHLPRLRTRYQLSDEDLMRGVGSFGGTAPEVMMNADLRRMLLHTLRTDLTALETYTWVEGQPLNCPITIFGGEDDYDVSQEELEPWRQHTSAEFSLQMMPGGHFYLYDAWDYLMNDISHKLLR